jgi:FkbM family methyltransferase
MSNKTHSSGIIYREDHEDDVKTIVDTLQDYKELFARVTPKDVVLDIGANIGDFAKMIPHVKHVHCFEPNPEVYAFLANEQGLKNATCINKAVSHERGEIEFRIAPDSRCSTAVILQRHRDAGQVQKVLADRFADVCANLKPTVIKMDIEGEEWAIDFEKDINPECRLFSIEIHYVNGYSWKDDFVGLTEADTWCNTITPLTGLNDKFDGLSARLKRKFPIVLNDESRPREVQGDDPRNNMYARVLTLARDI